MDASPPLPPHELDRQVASTMRAWRRARWILTALVGVVIAGSITLLWLIVLAQQTQLTAARSALVADTAALQRAQLASCGFYRDIAPLGDLQSLPLTVLIADSRRGFIDRRCPGRLPPASASFRHWARFYDIGPVP